MREWTVDLAVGESIHVGEYMLTVLEITNGEITFRIDSIDDVAELVASGERMADWPVPR